MVKMARFPSRAEINRRLDALLAEDDPDGIPLLPDFAQTLSSGIDDTVSNLRVLREAGHRTHEEESFKFQAIKQLTEECRLLRVQVAQLTTTANTKASKGIAKFEAALTAKFEKKMDSIYKIVGIGLTIIATLIAFKGR